MMNIYRIVKEQGRFYIEQRFFLIFWVKLKEWYCEHPYEVSFANREAAENHLEWYKKELLKLRPETEGKVVLWEGE